MKTKTAYCRICKKMTNWVFVGCQRDIFLKPVAAFYNCEKCHDIKAFSVEEEDETGGGVPISCLMPKLWMCLRRPPKKG